MAYGNRFMSLHNQAAWTSGPILEAHALPSEPDYLPMVVGNRAPVVRDLF